MKPALVIAFPTTDAVLERARRAFEVTFDGTRMTADRIVEAALASRASAVMVSAGQRIDSTTIERFPDSLKIVATSSVGFDHLDVAAARRRGVLMSNTPDVLTDCTADFAFLLVLAACRRLPEYESIMRSGWDRAFGQNEMLGIQVTGKTLGIIGMGRIGRSVAQRARGFGMKILYSSPRRLPPGLEQDAIYFPDFREMLPRCEILSLHAPSNASTEGLMNAQTFALLPKGAVFVNVSRGSLVDEEALLKTLKSGHLFAAGLDVFRNEPHFDRRFAELPNVVLCPHMGSATLETRNAMGLRALENIEAAVEGRAPRDPLG